MSWKRKYITFSFSTIMLQIFPFSFVSSPFPCIIATFLKRIFLKIKIFSNLRPCNSFGNGSMLILLCTGWHGNALLDKLLLHVLQTFSSSSNVFITSSTCRISYLLWSKCFRDRLYIRWRWHTVQIQYGFSHTCLVKLSALFCCLSWT